MDLTQSYIFSITRVKLSLYEQRILSKIVEYAQISLKGERPQLVKSKVQHKDPHCHIELPVAFVLANGNDHYNHVYAAARSLMGRTFEFIDPVDRSWHASPMIYNVTVRHKSGVLDFYVDRRMIDVILDFRMGYRCYDLEIALSLQQPAAVRMYILMCRQTAPITWTIANLKKMFGVEDKYKQTADFIKKVIDPAKRCLDEANVKSFGYVRNKEGQKVVSLTIVPVEPAVQQSDTPQAQPTREEVKLYHQLYMSLKLYAGFTIKELGYHQTLLKQFARTHDALNELYHFIKLSQRCNTDGTAKANPKGWLIDQMRKRINREN